MRMMSRGTMQLTPATHTAAAAAAHVAAHNAAAAVVILLEGVALRFSRLFGRRTVD